VREAAGELVTVAGTECRNPAFDVTPAALVTALVTERGVAQPVNRETVARLLDRS
jgi:methylthioribose-1-phosphate isomerase